MPVSSYMNNLVYVMDCMVEKESAQRDGIGFVANRVNYCYKLMIGLQGMKTPMRVKMFLIVNQPSWFASIWKIMKAMPNEEFGNKVHMIKFEMMELHLSPEFRDCLPDNGVGGGRQEQGSVWSRIVNCAHGRRIKESSPEARRVRPATAAKTGPLRSSSQ